MSNLFKIDILVLFGMIGTYINSLIGGWNSKMEALLIFMVIDMVCGFFVAFVFKKSQKTTSGCGSSKEFFKGLCKKIAYLFLIIIANEFDIILGFDYVRTATIFALLLNESISIIENMGLIGISIPEPIKKALDMLKDKNDNDNNEDK